MCARGPHGPTQGCARGPRAARGAVGLRAPLTASALSSGNHGSQNTGPGRSKSSFLHNIYTFNFSIHSVQFSSVAQSCPTLCDPMNRSTPGLRVHHQLPEFTQTRVHRVSDAIQPSHPRSSPSSPAPNPCRHQSIFQ